MKATVADNIKFYRTKLGFTQQQLADRLYVSRQTVASYESGRTEPDIAAMEKLAEIFEITVDELIGTIKSKRKRYSVYKSTFVVGIVLNTILFIRNTLFYIREQFFYIEPGVITEEMQKPLAVRMAISEAINMIDRYFAAIFIIGIFFIILFLIKSDKKYKLTHLFTFVLSLIITFVINIEVSILINPRGGLWRVNYYDIMRHTFWDNVVFIIILIPLIIVVVVYMAINRKLKNRNNKK